jgi:hypothetical protein
MKVIASVLLLAATGAFAGISIEPTAQVEDISLSRVVLEEVGYDRIEVEGYPHSIGAEFPGYPSLPFTISTYVLPPGMQIDDLQFIDAQWETLPGQFNIEPAQAYDSPESEFTPQDQSVFHKPDAYPLNPVEIINQGSCMGFGLVTVRIYPVRYLPAEGTLQYLSSVRTDITYGRADFELVAPVRSGHLSQSVREESVTQMVENSQDMSAYSIESSAVDEDRVLPLMFTGKPSIQGDCVDMVIITSEELEDEFQIIADRRTREGIPTVVRTLEWIEGEGGYTGCDLQEKIRNFIRECYSYWGTSAVILGGDSHIVPVRLVRGVFKDTPEDKYYGDMSSNSWANTAGYWKKPTGTYFDVTISRWPVDNGDDVINLISKIHCFETAPPDGFARRMLFAACDNGYNPADDFYDLYLDLQSSGQIGSTAPLDEVFQIYAPISEVDGNGAYRWFGDELLTRDEYLEQIGSGYQIVLHGDHSGVHVMGAGTIFDDWLFEYDLPALQNIGESSILWHCACFSGHFEDADCMMERGLLITDSNGFVAIVSCPKPQAVMYDFDYFIDALYPCGYGAPNPVRYLGEAFTNSQNQAYNSYVVNLFGDPFLYVWRDDPEELVVNPSTASVSTGTFNLSVSVSCNSTSVGNAQVCLYMEDEIYAIGYTNSFGTVSFTGLTASSPGEISVTASKRENTSGLVNFISDTEYVIVQQGTGPYVTLDEMLVDDGAEGELNPGETVYLDVTADNTGTATASSVVATLEIDHADVTVLDDSQVIGNIPTGIPVFSNNAFQIELDADAELLDPVVATVTFRSSLNQTWETQWVINASAGALSLPIYELDAEHNASFTELSIDLNRIIASNEGIGDISDLTLTAGNFRPATSGLIVGDLSETVTLIEGGEGCELTDPMMIRIRNIPAGDPWANSSLSGCRFELTASDASGNTYESVTVDMEYLMTGTVPGDPTDIYVAEATDTSLTVKWSGSCTDYYLYYRESSSMGPYNRLGWSPVPIESAVIIGLDPQTGYSIQISAVDQYGQESQRVSSSGTTCLETLASLQVNGCPGAGTVIIDGEMYIVTNTGYIYDWNMSSIGSPGYIYCSDCSFTGCSAGDVDNDGDIDLVAAGNRIVDQGKVFVKILLNDGSGNLTSAYEFETGFGEHLREVNGVPVLLQADNGYLEIAMLTCTKWLASQGRSTLHVWKYESNSDRWEELFTQGSMEFQNNDHLSYTPPALIGDYDADLKVEIAVATNNDDGEPCIFVVDLSPSGTIREIELGLDNTYHIRSSLAVVNYSGNSYITGVVAKHTTGDNEWKRLFIVELTSSPASVIFSDEEQLTRFFYSDQYGGGPAIGLINDDAVPDIVACIDDELRAWELDGDELVLRSPMELNPIFMDEDQNVSAPVINGTLSNNNVMSIGYSTQCYGITNSRAGEIIEGLPVYSEDQVFGAPMIMDLTGDSDLELLTYDNSGFIRILDLGASPGEEYWPVFLHDFQRTGLYGFGSKKDGCDITVSNVIESESGDTERADNHVYRVTVEITDPENALSGDISSVDRSSIDVSSDMISDPSGYVIEEIETRSSDVRSVEIAAFSGEMLVSIQRIPLTEGIHELSFRIPHSVSTNLLFVADPYDEIEEQDEGNNCSEGRSIAGSGALTINIENPVTRRMMLSITNSTASPQLVTGSLYSIDGRVISEGVIELPGGSSRTVDLFEGTSAIPAGFYALRLRYNGIEEVKKVILLP